jgi:oligopeptide transport system substrate-binding protein
MRAAMWLCSALAGLAALSLAWSAKSPPEGGLTVVFGDEPRTLDPALASLVLEGRILTAVLEGLTVADPATSVPRPGAAESWTESEGGRRVTFRLRENLRWSDGSPLTARDFRDSWLRVLSTPEAAYWQLWEPVRGAAAFREMKTSAEDVGLAAPDDRTLVVDLDRPAPWFTALTSTMWFLPVPSHAVERHGRRWTRPENFVGNGPFTLSEWLPNHRIVATKNPNYWNAATVRLPAITFLSVTPGTAQLNLYESGLARWIADPPPALVRDLAGRPDLHVSQRLAVSFVRMGCARKPFDDPRVRRAFSLAVDRDRVVRTNGAGQIPWAAFVPPGLPEWRPQGLATSDPARARELLAQAGFPGGRGFPVVRFVYPPDREFAVVAQTLHAIWLEELGVSVVLERTDRKDWLRRRRTLEYDLCLSSWIADYPDPASFLEIFTSESGNNQTGWKCAEFDARIERARREAGEARRTALAEAEDVLLREAPVAPLYVPVTIELWDPKLEGIAENPVGIHPLRGVGWR